MGNGKVAEVWTGRALTRKWACFLLVLLLASFAPAPSAAAEPSATVSPGWAKAGARRTFDFTFVAGEGGLRQGGAVEIVFFCKNDREFGRLLWSCPRIGEDLGRITASSPRASVTASVLNGRVARVTVTGGEVPPGGTVRLEYDGKVQTIARRFVFHVRGRPDASSDWTVLPPERSPVVEVLPLAPRVVLAFAPADVGPGEPFELGISVLDRYGNPATAYRGSVRFSSTDPEADLPGPYAFKGTDGGLHVFQGVRLPTPGLQRISVEDDEVGTEEVDANWTEVHASAPALRRWFGETHFHTGAGNAYDGWRDRGGDHKGNYARIDEAYAYLRDVWRMDFASAAEHDFGWNEAAAAIVRPATEAANEPGRFTAFHAYEWTRDLGREEGGHRIVLYEDAPGAVFSSDDPDTDTQSELFAALRAQGLPAIVIPHPMKPDPRSSLWAVRANDLQPVMEIYSVQNRNEATGGNKLAFELDWGDAWSVREAWRRGFFIGVIGSSDNHLGTPGYHRLASLTENTDGGYAVVLSSSNTRSSLFEGFQQRRTYATTGERALLAMEVDGNPVGSVLERSSGAPHLEGYVAGTAAIKRLRLFRADYQRGFVDLTPADRDPRPDVYAFALDDPGWRGHSLYYVRAEQEDGEIVWSSPVWVLEAGTPLLEDGFLRGGPGWFDPGPRAATPR